MSVLREEPNAPMSVSREEPNAPMSVSREEPNAPMSVSREERELRELAARGAAEFGAANGRAGAIDLLGWTDENFGGNYVVASNMQDAVLIDMASRIRPGVDVLFLDTGYHFAETLGTRDAVEAIYDIRLLNVIPEHAVAEQDRLLGKNLFARDPNECCRLRKVVPLRRTLQGYSAWVTGLRRGEALTRANAPLVSFDEAFGLVKVNPLATWTDEEVADYIAEYNVIVNPLVEEGYPSIGCAPCTAKPLTGADPRSGRWQGHAKTECGLHSA